MKHRIHNKSRWCLTGVFCVFAITIASPATAERIRKNPFDLPSGVTFQGQTLPSARDLSLQAVVEGKKRRIATINNRNYLVGDHVKGRKLIEIQPDHVVLAEGTQRLQLKLNRQAYSIRVRPTSSETP